MTIVIKPLSDEERQRRIEKRIRKAFGEVISHSNETLAGYTLAELDNARTILGDVTAYKAATAGQKAQAVHIGFLVLCSLLYQQYERQ